MRVFMTAMALATFPCAALAQTPAPVESASAASEAAAPASVRIPAGTLVQLEITEHLDSENSRQEQLFAMRLAEPIVIGGREVVPAGALAGGEVIDAAPSAFGGRQGRLILSGRFLEIAGQRVRIRAMHVSGAGEDRGSTALAVGMLAGPAGFFVQGGEVHIQPGARANARIAVDVDVPLEPAEAPTEPESQSLGGETQ